MTQLLSIFNSNSQKKRLFVIVSSIALIMLSFCSNAKTDITLVDDFSNSLNNSLGLPRQIMDDKMVGGKTTAAAQVNNGVMHLKGTIEPPRGQIGWASAILLLDPEGKAVDTSAYKGIRLLIKVNHGQLSVSANSTEITNFDYHSAVIATPTDGKFHEVKIPFDSMKRTWSEQITLNKQSINSISLVAFSLQKAPFSYEIDELSFY